MATPKIRKRGSVDIDVLLKSSASIRLLDDALYCFVKCNEELVQLQTLDRYLTFGSIGNEILTIKSLLDTYCFDNWGRITQHPNYEKFKGVLGCNDSGQVYYPGLEHPFSYEVEKYKAELIEKYIKKE